MKKIIAKRIVFSVISLVFIIVTIGFFLRSTSAQPGTPALDALIATGKSQLFTKTIFGGLDAYNTFKTAANSTDYSAPTTTSAQKVQIRTYLAVTRMLDVMFRNDGGAEASTLTELLEKYGITRTNTDFESLNIYPQRDRYGNTIIPSTAPNSEAIRAFLAGPFLTAINASIADMDAAIVLLGGTETKEIISKDLTGSDKDIEVDDGDYYLFRAMLKALKAYVLTLSAYDMNVNVREIASLANMNALNTKELFDRNTQLLKVLTTAGTPSYNGAAKLAEAKATLIGAIDDYMTASGKIRNDNDLTAGTQELFSFTEDSDLYGEGLLRENMVKVRASLTNNEAVTFIEKRVGVEYHVYGGASFTMTEPYWWEKGYHPERYGYAYLGKASATATFSGTHNCYIVMTRPGNMAPVDAIQGSGGAYYSTDTTGNTNNYWNINGAPDTNYALVGGGNGGDYYGFVVIRPPAGTTSSLKVYLASAPGVAPRETYGPTSVNFYPIFGNGVTALSPRDLLPDLTGYSSGGQMISGTVGHGLGNDPTLGGIFPAYTQDRWRQEFDALQPAGLVTIPTATINVQDGSVSDWGSIPPVFTDVTGDARGYTSSDLSKLYLAKDTNYLYIRMDMAGAIPQSGSEPLTYNMNPQKTQGPDMPGDVQIHISYNPSPTPVWQASIVKMDLNGNYYQVAPLPANGFQIFSNTIEIAAPLAQVGEIGGRFIHVSTNMWWGVTIDNNHTGLQIAPAATVTGALTVPQYDGTGLIHIGVFRYDGIYDTHPEKKLLGATTIYPGQYSPGMTYTIGNLPLGVNVFVAAFWDKDLTGYRSAGDVFARTDFFTLGTTNTGKTLNTTQSPVIMTSANPQLTSVSIYKEYHYENNDAANYITRYYLGATIAGASPTDATVVVSGPNGFQATLSPENVLLLNHNMLTCYYVTQTPLADGTYTFSLLDATGRTVAQQYRWYSSSVTVPAMPDFAAFQVNGVPLTSSGNNFVTYVTSLPITLSWNAVAGAQGYQVVVRSWKGDVVLLLNTQATSVAIPTGVGQPNTPYRFQVRALDNWSSPQARARSKEAWFYTGPAATANPVIMNDAKVYFVNEGTRKYAWLAVRIPGVAPWDVQSLTVSCPNGTNWPDGTSVPKSFDLTPYQGMSTRAEPIYYELSLPDSATPPANGTYTFTVTDKSARTGSATATYTYSPVTGVDNATLSPISNYYADTATPLFSWGAAPGNPTYILRIYDYNGSAFFYQAQTTGTTYQMPAGFLLPGGTYRWRLHIYNANGNQTNTEKRPITILPAPTSTGANIWGRINRNTGQTGQVRVTLANLKGASYSQQITLGPELWNNWFNFTNVPDGSYMISAFMDVNGNGLYDAGEPYGYWRTETGVREVVLLNRSLQGSEVEWIELKNPASGDTGIAGTISSTLAQAVTGNVMMFRVGDFIRDVYPSTVPEPTPGYRPPGGVIGLNIQANTGTAYTASKINAPPGGNIPMAEGVYDVIFMTGSFDGVAKTGSLIFHQRYNNILVNKGALTGNMNFTIASSAILSGNVTDGGFPAAQAQVLLLSGGTDVYTVVGRGYTDASGNYNFANVPVGNYTIAVFINGVKRAVVLVNITSPAASTTIKDVAVSPPLKGDLNNDTLVNLADAILALKVLAGMQPAGIRGDYTTVTGVDVDNDGKVGQAEMVYILQAVAGLR